MAYCSQKRDKIVATTSPKQERNESLDIAKAICIILMVIGHSGCPPYLKSFAYMFHMPAFFFISGYLLNDQYGRDGWNMIEGLKHKLRGLYFPFVKWSIVFLFFNVISRFFIYGDLYSFQEIGIKVFRILTMSHLERLVGGYWFLVSLFFTSILSLLVVYSLRQTPDKRKFNLLLLFVILSLSVGILQYYFPTRRVLYFDEKTCMGTAFYITGYIFRKKNILSNIVNYSFLLLLIPAYIACFRHFGIDTCSGWDILLYYFIAVCGTLGIISVATHIFKWRGLVLNYIGKKTLIILTFHFLAFKFVSAVYILFSNLPIQALGDYPVLSNINNKMWISYSIAGIIFPLLIDKFMSFMKNYINAARSV